MYIHAKTQSVLMHVPEPMLIRGVIPQSKILDHADYNVAVRHTIDSVRILRNMGYDVPAPIRTNYRWPGRYKPFSHQLDMAEFLTLNKRAFNLSEMGVGKSAAALWAADWMMENKLIKKALILSPLSTLERVWANDLFDVLMHRRVATVYGSREQRLEALSRDVDFYILNHDGLSVGGVLEAIRTDPDINLVIVDEASMFRNAATKKYKNLVKILRDDMHLWLLTGTPCPNSPTDAWALARLVNPAKVPQFFGAFRNMTMYKASQFKWATKTDAYSVAFEAMQPAIRFKKADCLDLPPVITMSRQSALTKEQEDAYKSMLNFMIAEAKEQQITAANAADKINKLRQILCGVVRDTETKEYVEIPHEPRVEVMLEAIESASAKVIVVVPFKGIINTLEKKISKHYSCAILNGDVSPKKRNDIIRAFKETPDPHVLLCHPKVMAHGLNLTEADTLIFYAPIYSNDEFQQVTERFNRTGQTRKMTIVKLGSHPLDWRIYKMVEDKRLTQEGILGLYSSIIE